ncbi:MAG TPA: hypothetical protein DEP23_06215 [Ruminococcaceae bacterium]|nr:hypothetical protein [Oscillospiraceae bacterium]
MQLNDFRDILLEADGNITKRFGAGTGNYTVWTPGGIDRVMSDDTGDENVQRVYVDRYTKLDNDPVVQAIWNALEGAFISFEYEQDTENDTKYIHHTFTCYIQIN